MSARCPFCGEEPHQLQDCPASFTREKAVGALIAVRRENADIMRKWESYSAIFCGALQLLKEAGLAPGSTELIAAAVRFDAARKEAKG